ncbi:alpha/beta-hydrolase [Sparassis latifolia]
MPTLSTSQWIGLLSIPAALLLAQQLTTLSEPTPLTIHRSLSSLPPTSSARRIYPEDFYEGGAYVQFPNGTVRYWLIGPEDGTRIVLIHGLSIPAFIWRDVAHHLAKNGFRVLLYDLYGRGYSDAPQTEYTAELYTTQLAMLLQYIGWKRVHVAGVSMGGAIATSFSAQFPHLVSSKVALIASVGLYEPRDIPLKFKLLSSPLVQLVTSSAPARAYRQYLSQNNVHSGSVVADAEALVCLQSAYLPGFDHAIASSLREGPLRGLAPAFAQLGRDTGKRVFLIWGTHDPVVPFVNAERVQGLVPHAELMVIQHGGHELTMTHPGEVGPALVRFFAD